MSMAQGFVQGFGMMNQFMQQQDAKERQAALYAQNEQRYQDQLAWRDQQWQHQLGREQKQDAITDENRMLDYAAKGITADMTPEQKQGVMMNQRAVTLQQAEEDRQWGRKKDQLSMQATQAQIANYALDRRIKGFELEDKQFQTSLRNLYMGTGGENDVLALGDYGRGLVKREGEFNQFAQQFAQLNDSVGKATTIEDREKSVGQLLGLVDSDIGRNVMNSAFMSSYAQRMKQDPNIEKINSAGFMPLDGKLVPLMDIEYKDGTKKTGVPATTGKTGDKTDTVVALTPEQIRKQVEQAYTIQGQVKAQIESNPALAQKMGLKEKPVSVGYGSKLVDPVTGEVIAENERKTTGGLTANQNVAALRSLKIQADKQIKDLTSQLSTLPKDQQNAVVQQINELKAHSLSLTDAMAEAGVSVPNSEGAKITTTSGQGLPTQSTAEASGGKVPIADFAKSLGGGNAQSVKW